jgi:DNA processing protein
MLEKQELKYWLAWNKVKEIGPIRFSNLRKSFSSLEEAWKSTNKAKSIHRILHIGQATWEKIEFEKQRIDPDSELLLLEKMKVNVITIEEDDYPDLLKNIYDPPPILYYKGNFREIIDNSKSIAVVGSRKATYYGRKIAHEIALELASRGYVIISGLARGIDTNAHLGALEAGRETVAVLGCGVDCIYPAENISIADRIIKNGAIITEFPIYRKPEKNNFPRRNRIISGLSTGTLVVEAAQKSGALITADYALEQGREVFAIPGSIHSFLSTGCHALIKQGAKLVNSYRDIIEELETKNIFYNDNENRDSIKKDKRIDTDNLNANEKHFLEYISTDPLHIDELTNLTELSPAQVNETLLSLELKNIIREVEGKRYIRI